LSAASQRGRTECVPPRRSPLASSRGSPARRPTWGLAPSRRGGLRTPARNPSRQSKRCPFLPPANRTPQVITTCLGSPPARLCGRTECVPPRKLPLASSPGFPAGRPTWGLAPSRRGGLRTPARNASRRPQDHPPFGHRPLANSPLITTSLGLRPALPNGRAERIPPRKLPSALSPGFPAGPPTLGLAPSRRGGLRTPATFAARYLGPHGGAPIRRKPLFLDSEPLSKKRSTRLLPVLKFPRIPEVRWNGLAPFGACGHGDWAVSLTRTEEGSRTGDFCSMG
jgi:hypothetical protein